MQTHESTAVLSEAVDHAESVVAVDVVTMVEPALLATIDTATLASG